MKFKKKEIKKNTDFKFRKAIKARSDGKMQVGCCTELCKEHIFTPAGMTVGRMGQVLEELDEKQSK